MHSLDLVSVLVGGLAAALLFGLVAHRCHLPPIVGYLLAGVLVGPHTPGFVAHEGIASQLAEVGVVLLLFGVGLEFHLETLLNVGRVAVPAALAQIVIVTGAAAAIMRFFGFELTAGLVLGIAVSVSSTVVLMRVLAERGELHTPDGHLAVGWLVVEDLVTVLVLVLLPGLVSTGGDPGKLVMNAGIATLKLGALVAFTLLAGGRLIPWLLNRVVATKSRELFTLAVLVVALGIGFAAAKLFGASMALGAFLAGMVVGRSDFAFRAASEALPMRDAFAVLFFVSVGMLFDPSFLLERPGLVAATLGLVMLAKPLAATLMLLVLRRPARSSVMLGVGRGQIGEFSFILAALGTELEVLPGAASSALVAASILSITLNPLLFKLAPRAGAFFPERAPESEAVAAPTSRHSVELRHRAVIVGYGPVGQTVARLLSESSIVPTVIEMNLDTIRSLRERGINAVYGDASRREILEQAGLADAVALILSAPLPSGAEAVVREARDVNPKVYVIARANYLAQVDPLRRAGANAAFSGEGEIALAMTELILTRLGATPEQIDHERERVHVELHGTGSLDESGRIG
jgi:monovalent cation:H+ antiporter-2, CPA2 family